VAGAGANWACVLVQAECRQHPRGGGGLFGLAHVHPCHLYLHRLPLYEAVPVVICFWQRRRVASHFDFQRVGRVLLYRVGGSSGGGASAA
jgi:hypothetical protein